MDLQDIDTVTVEARELRGRLKRIEALLEEKEKKP